MEHNLPIIDYIRYSNDMWTNAEDGSFIISVQDSNGFKPAFKLPADVLSKKHPDLPNGVSALIKLNSFDGDGGFTYFKQVYSTMEYMLGDILEFTDTSGRFRVLSQIRKCEVNAEEQVVHFLGASLTLHQVEIYGTKVVFSDSDNKPENITVSYSELSMRYPDWVKKYEVALALDLSISDMVKMVFIKDVDTAFYPDVTNINFD